MVVLTDLIITLEALVNYSAISITSIVCVITGERSNCHC